MNIQQITESDMLCKTANEPVSDFIYVARDLILSVYPNASAQKEMKIIMVSLQPNIT